MTGIENARHDLSDARFSVDTAIEILSGVEEEMGRKNPELHDLIARLAELKGGLDDAVQRLAGVRDPFDA